MALNRSKSYSVGGSDDDIDDDIDDVQTKWKDLFNTAGGFQFNLSVDNDVDGGMMMTMMTK